MRIFVTGTGRCGSVSFYKACEHLTNYTCGNETRCGMLEYPDRHIEINPQLRVCLSQLIDKYPQSLFVHVIRERKSCIESLAALNHGIVMKAYEVLYPTVVENATPLIIAKRFYDCENAIIASQLAQASNKLNFRLEAAKIDFTHFWKRISGEGNLEAAIESWDHPTNTRSDRGEL